METERITKFCFGNLWINQRNPASTGNRHFQKGAGWNWPPKNLWPLELSKIELHCLFHLQKSVDSLPDTTALPTVVPVSSTDA
jgi:hypothetical protein